MSTKRTPPATPRAGSADGNRYPKCPAPGCGHQEFVTTLVEPKNLKIQTEQGEHVPERVLFVQCEKCGHTMGVVNDLHPLVTRLDELARKVVALAK